MQYAQASKRPSEEQSWDHEKETRIAVTQSNREDKEECIGDGGQSCHGRRVIGRSRVHNNVFCKEHKEEERAPDREADPPCYSGRQNGQWHADDKGGERGQNPPLERGSAVE